ncbi:hypothetical protein GCM10009799_30200 [Nocardiopsis rhodophaea]|uniref:Uncharacterized protein n=1 Tax=Nocardiopsis rhodophaea TaxID=280238 RepID=A0ABP5EP68_9ACTN
MIIAGGGLREWGALASRKAPHAKRAGQPAPRAPARPHPPGDRRAQLPAVLGAAFHPRTPERATADKAAQRTRVPHLAASIRDHGDGVDFRPSFDSIAMIIAEGASLPLARRYVRHWPGHGHEGGAA